jgi:hypothetical protein
MTNYTRTLTDKLGPLESKGRTNLIRHLIELSGVGTTPSAGTTSDAQHGWLQTFGADNGLGHGYIQGGLDESGSKSFNDQFNQATRGKNWKAYIQSFGRRILSKVFID